MPRHPPFCVESESEEVIVERDEEGRLTRIASGPLAERTMTWGDHAMEEVILRPIGSNHERPGGPTSRVVRTWRYDDEGRVLGYEQTGDDEAAMVVRSHHDNGQLAEAEIDGELRVYDPVGRAIEGPGRIGHRVYDDRGFLVEHVRSPGLDGERVLLREHRGPTGELERVELSGWPSFHHGQQDTPHDLPVEQHPNHVCMGPLPGSEPKGLGSMCCYGFLMVVLAVLGVRPPQ